METPKLGFNPSNPKLSKLLVDETEVELVPNRISFFDSLKKKKQPDRKVSLKDIPKEIPKEVP